VPEAWTVTLVILSRSPNDPSVRLTVTDKRLDLFVWVTRPLH
jgi:hypothetical protein